jgi:phosphatidylinositol alpha-1,6-mannosyltransferase
LGIVYLEASATGVPVVAGQSGGAPETVVEGVTGTVVDGTDIDAVALAITAVLSDRSAAAEMGANGREHVLQSWQWSAIAARLRQLL